MNLEYKTTKIAWLKTSRKPTSNVNVMLDSTDCNDSDNDQPNNQTSEENSNNSKRKKITTKLVPSLVCTPTRQIAAGENIQLLQRERITPTQRKNKTPEGDKSEVRWICIPGATPRMERHAVVPVSATEVARVRNQLLCRPAEGFGHNWFQLELKDKPKLLSDSEPQNTRIEKPPTKQVQVNPNPNPRRKIKRPGKISLYKSNPPTATTNARAKQPINEMKSNNSNNKSHQRFYFNNRTTPQIKDKKVQRHSIRGRLLPVADRECTNSNNTSLHVSSECTNSNNTSLHVSSECNNSNDTPLYVSSECTNSNDKSLHVSSECNNSNDTPLHVSSECSNSNDTPLHVSSECNNSNDTSLHVSSECNSSNDTQLHVSSECDNSNDTPLHVSSECNNSNDTPLHVSGECNNSNDTPLHVSSECNNSNDTPLHVSSECDNSNNKELHDSSEYNDSNGTQLDMLSESYNSEDTQMRVSTECNNSNDTTLQASGSPPSTSRKSNQKQSITGKIIRVEGDGRCLFRSLVTCLSSDLQKTRRDDFGTPFEKHDANYETLMADILRAKVVRLMTDNAHFYGQLEQLVINADQPVPRGYSHFRDRLTDMTLTSTMPGDLELNATSMALERQLLVLDVNLSPIVFYGKDRFPLNGVVAVRYTRLGQDVGHYDSVIPDLNSFSLLDSDDERIEYENTAGLPSDMFNLFNNLILDGRNKMYENNELSSRGQSERNIQAASCGYPYCNHQLQYHHQPQHQHKQQQYEPLQPKKQPSCDFNQSKDMDWSPNAFPSQTVEGSTQTNDDNNDNHKIHRYSEPKSSIVKNISLESLMRAHSKDIILDILADNIAFVVADPKNKKDQKKIFDFDLDELISSTKHRYPFPVRSRNIGNTKGKTREVKRFCCDSTKWKTAKYRTKGVITRSSERKTRRPYKRKLYRRVRAKHCVQRRVFASKMKQKAKKASSKRDPKQGSKSPTNSGPTKLNREKVIVAKYNERNDSIAEKRPGGLFPNKPGNSLDETLTKEIGPRCEKSIGEIVPQVKPPKGKQGFDRGGANMCVVCQGKIPINQSRTVKIIICSICGRAAHRKCIPSDPKGGDENYFVCSLCMRE